MRCKFFTAVTSRPTFLLLASTALITLYCQAFTSTIILQGTAILTKLPHTVKTNRGPPNASQSYSTQDPFRDISQDVEQNFQTQGKNKENIVASAKTNFTTPAGRYKIELEDDDGSDYPVTKSGFTLQLIMQGVQRLHQVAVAYEKSFKHDPPAVTSDPTSTITNYDTQQRILPIQNFLKPSICDIKIHLAPCNCTRHLTSTLTSCPSQELEQSEIIAKINDTFGLSTCSDWATIRGNNQFVISFSLFGKFPSAYFNGAVSLMQRLKEVYPDWSVRFYHDLDLSDPVKRDWMCSLACKYQQLDFCSSENLPGGNIQHTTGTVWRLAVMGDPLVRRYIIRDTDSPILQREVDAVHEWLNSDKCFHLMRDNPAHSEAIMAGAWGGCDKWHPEAMARLRDLVFRWSNNKSTSSQDQSNVVLLLWPTFKKSHLAHDSYWCNTFPGSRPFPTKRENFTFVGMRSLREYYSEDSIKDPCPVQCRPAKHKDWIYC
ncbi:uncharacterized protein LOC121860430 isoform X2 [Homarus americanus]|uniref:uncharacterized protein LOC121860430 isoform X2 n=1 Tax=Homarus americanus TaxID=6706 RepID=UPI001C47E04D|nr:uncharacterized protein LOC121860430 isoform X2 [Homarus americanus]